MNVERSRYLDAHNSKVGSHHPPCQHWPLTTDHTASGPGQQWRVLSRIDIDIAIYTPRSSYGE